MCIRDSYHSLQGACVAGVEAEIANVAMYERLLMKTHRADLLDVLRRLQEASQQRHLPAFQRGAQRVARNGAQGCGMHQGARHRGKG